MSPPLLHDTTSGVQRYRTAKEKKDGRQQRTGPLVRAKSRFQKIGFRTALEDTCHFISEVKE